MVERRIELDRRYQRTKKLRKLKRKLNEATSDADRTTILNKIHIISPWWTAPAPK